MEDEMAALIDDINHNIPSENEPLFVPVIPSVLIVNALNKDQAFSRYLNEDIDKLHNLKSHHQHNIFVVLMIALMITAFFIGGVILLIGSIN